MMRPTNSRTMVAQGGGPTVSMNGGRPNAEETKPLLSNGGPPPAAGPGPPRTTALGPPPTGRQASVPPVVQFASLVHYVVEDCGHARVQVLRFGDLSRICHVNYFTRDVAAKHPRKYKEKKGTIDFQVGEEIAWIEVEVVQDASFDTNLDFMVILDQPVDCVIGSSLGRCRIMIIDDDVFPTNKFRAEILANDMDDIGLKLLWSFMVFMFERVPDVRGKAIFTAVLDQLHNVSYIASIYLQIYMVNTVFAVNDPDSEERLLIPTHYGGRMSNAVLLAFLYMLPTIILTYSEYFQLDKLGVGGALKMHLKVNLFRKFLYYSQTSHEAVSVQALHTAMLDEVAQCVANGFLIVFRILLQTGKSGMVLFFLVSKNPGIALPIIIYPAAMMLFLNLRYKQTMILKDLQQVVEVSTMQCFDAACADIGLIKDYNQRSAMVERFEKSIQQQGPPTKNFLMYEFKTEKVMPWITMVVIGVFMIWGGFYVLLPKDDPRHLSFGVFLATIGIYKDAGALFSTFYLDIKALYGVVGPLKGLIHLLNLPTDVTSSLEKQNVRNHSTKDALAMIPMPTQEAHVSGMAASRYDELQITLKGVALKHLRGGPAYPALQNIFVKCPQGKLVALLGPHGSGKRTLLAMIEGSVAPESGQVFMPLHLQCLCVPNVPAIFANGGLYENLAFGRLGIVKSDRVFKICKRVGLADHVIRRAKEDFARYDDSGMPPPPTTEHKKAGEAGANVRWFDSLSHTELRRVHLVRALVYNPEVLLLHRPTDEFEALEAAAIMTHLREYVDKRGLDFSDQEMMAERPHTVFISTGQDRERALAAADIADIVWRISEHGMKVEVNSHPSLRDPHAPQGDGPIVQSWQREAQSRQKEVEMLQQDLLGTEMSRRELEQTARGLKDDLSVTAENLRQLTTWQRQEDARLQRDAGRLCKVRVCGGDFY
eukprot:TRINITY_DN34928_c0_g1_i1.p1 TRINITY_DN34928_c0_g1~~TRINITY_DN34928_c0_g1_i1.p1  ORF type:complete len:936 (-),score=243.51 TRINITY_DN34928_c0_g1_i1:280-3087(-)